MKLQGMKKIIANGMAALGRMEKASLNAKQISSETLMRLKFRMCGQKIECPRR